jgi:hypothetical protein
MPSKGMRNKHIPRTSTIASSPTGVPSVRSSERSDEALSKRLFTKCSDSVFTAYSLLLRADRHSWLEADICGW